MKKYLFIFLLVFGLAGATGCKKEVGIVKLVDESIALFVENIAEDYLKCENIDLNVMMAIHALELNNYDIKLSDYLSFADVEDFVLTLDITRPNGNFKAIYLYDVFGERHLEAERILTEYRFSDLTPWDYDLALFSLNKVGNNDDLKNDILANIIIIKEEHYRDADFAGSALMALSDYDLNKDSLFALIDGAISADGIMSYGSANACSTAQTILGLVASNINPTKGKYAIDGTNLVKALLKYQNDNGSFNYLQVDASSDLIFSTPQAFSALVAFKIFTETKQKFVLFA